MEKSRISFVGSGYCFKYGINYEMEVETESDSDWLLKYNM